MKKQEYKAPGDEWENGCTEWKDAKGDLHREEGPAVVGANGYKEYWIHGELHNEEGPAVVYPDGTVEYFIHGELHREEGPAVVRADGTKEYYLHGEFLTEKAFLARKNSCEGKTVIVDGKTYRLMEEK